MEVAVDVRPARLPSGGVEMAVSVAAVRDHDPRIGGADQRGELLAVAVLGDLHEHGAWRGCGPSRTTFTAGAPARLINVHRRLIEDPVLQLQMRARQRVRGA